ncbi:MAG TPA: 2-dehydropantoate 2-reductase [Vicinamibacterales bacterium]|nr:2-dehydropantoate 2-reductase [Vicinamibacterales bacterium]
MRIAIVGSGGVGGYFGGRLAAAGADVAFVARGAHLAALRANGLRIESPQGNLHLERLTATDDSTTIGPVDAVFVAVKLYDTVSALPLLPPLIGSETVVISFQNGVESVDMMAAAVPRRHLAAGTTYVQASISEPGVIRHVALDRIIFGELDGARTPRLERLLEVCLDAGVSSTLSTQIVVEIWSKFVHLSAMSGITAVTRCPVGVIRDDPDLLAMWQAAVVESMAVARASGIDLARSYFDDLMRLIQQLPRQSESSMLADLEHQRRLELPWLSGAVVRMGRALDVETPIHRFITTVLGPHVNGAGRQGPPVSKTREIRP